MPPKERPVRRRFGVVSQNGSSFSVADASISSSSSLKSRLPSTLTGGESGPHTTTPSPFFSSAPPLVGSFSVSASTSKPHESGAMTSPPTPSSMTSIALPFSPQHVSSKAPPPPPSSSSSSLAAAAASSLSSPSSFRPPSTTSPPRRMITRAYRKGISPIAQLRLLHTTSPDRGYGSSSPSQSSRGSGGTENGDGGGGGGPSSSSSFLPLSLSFKRPYRTRKMKEAEMAAQAMGGGGGGGMAWKSTEEAEDAKKIKETSVGDGRGHPLPHHHHHRRRSPSIEKRSVRHVGRARKEVSTPPPPPASASSFLFSPPQPSPALRGGVLRCVCNAFLLSPKECLLECRHCRNYCHPSCVGIDHLEMKLRLREDSFVCPFCAVPSSTSAASSAAASTPTVWGGGSPHHPSGDHVRMPAELPLAPEKRNGPMGGSLSDEKVPPGRAEDGAEVRSLSWRRTGPSSVAATRSTTPSGSTLLAPVVPAVGEASSTGSGRTAIPPPSPSTTSMNAGCSRAAVPGASSSTVAILERGGEGSAATHGMSFSPGALPPAPRQAPQRLREVTDSFPPNVDVLCHALRVVQQIATRVLPYTILELPHTPLEETQVKQCMECCEVAVSEALLSASYPMYCLREVRAALHSYVQGVLLEVPVHEGKPFANAQAVPSTTTSASPPLAPGGVPPKKEEEEEEKGSHFPNASPPPRRIVSLLFTNGMDYYGNLKPTITQLKSAIQRGHITKAELYKRVKAVDALYPEDPNPPHLHHFVDQCLAITDVSDFVHITLSATHPSYQGKRLATILFTLELLKWSIRGRRRAFLNMAIEKHVVPIDGNGTEEKQQEKEDEVQKEGKRSALGSGEKRRGGLSSSSSSSSSSPPPKGPPSSSSSTPMTTTGHRMELVAPAASCRLYQRFGFREIHPRVDPLTGKSRFTPLEADMGRVMVNFDIPTAALRAAAWLEREYMGSAHTGPEERKEMHGGTGDASGGGAGREATPTPPIRVDPHHLNTKHPTHPRGSSAHATTPKKGGTVGKVVPMSKLWGNTSTFSNASSSSSISLPSTVTTPSSSLAGMRSTVVTASERGFSSSYPQCIDVEGEED